MADKLKIIFMGTPDFSVPALRNLIANPRMHVVAVYTQPPRPAGRGQQIRPSPFNWLLMNIKSLFIPLKVSKKM